MRIWVYTILVMAMVWPIGALAADGTSKLSAWGSRDNATWDYTLKDNKVEGRLFGFARSVGPVSLEKDSDGNWEGRFQSQGVSVHRVLESVESDGDSITEVTLRLVPGGYYSFRIKQELEDDEDGEYRVTGNAYPNGRGSIRMHGHSDGKHLTGGNQYLGYSLKKRSSDSNEFRGTTLAYDRLGRVTNNYFTDLEATGELHPETLIESDKILFLILYHLPYSMFGW